MRIELTVYELEDIKMKKILIFGGTQFVGKRLVSSLLEKDFDITLVSRGNWPVPHCTSIRHVVADRFKPESFKAIQKNDWDVIVDQLAFCGYDAKIIVDCFEGKVGKIVATTSSAVYDTSVNCVEDSFNSLSMNFEDLDISKHIPPEPDTISYVNGKRAVEYIYSQSNIPTTLIRFPKIIGLDDLSFRFFDLYRKIKNNEEVKISRSDKKVSLINSREAARFMSFVISHSFSGPINACFDETFSLSYFESKFQRKVKIKKSDDEESLFLGNEILLNSNRAKDMGFSFEHLYEYLDELTFYYDIFNDALDPK